MNYRFITSEDDLKQTCRKLSEEPVIGIDLEANGMYAFKEKICLIQVADASQVYLIDPFQIKEMVPLVELLADTDTVKVFHGSDFDIRSLDRDYQAVVTPLFDTEIACRFLGVKERGLGALLKKHFNINTAKKYQKADWTKRPFKEEMVEYSAVDAAYLTKLYEILTSELERLERLDWALEECEIQAQVRYENNHDLPLFLKVKGAGILDGRSLAVLENLLQLRVDIARKKDRPLFKIMSNASLLTLAEKKPSTISKMEKSRALSPRQSAQYGVLCLNAVKAAMALKKSQLPKYPRTKRPRRDNYVFDRIRQLKRLRTKLSETLNMEPGFLINNALIDVIAGQNPTDTEQLCQVSSMRKWQVKAMGNDIISTLQAG